MCSGVGGRPWAERERVSEYVCGGPTRFRVNNSLVLMHKGSRVEG